VVRIGNGFFTVRMDGPVYETVVCRVLVFFLLSLALLSALVFPAPFGILTRGRRIFAFRSAFEGYEAIEKVKKIVDPDWEFAMQLQLEDGWARRSTRVKRS